MVIQDIDTKNMGKGKSPANGKNIQVKKSKVLTKAEKKEFTNPTTTSANVNGM